jgi:hypothetical protein
MASSRRGDGFIYAQQMAMVREKSGISRLLSFRDPVLAKELAAAGFHSI